MMSTKVRLGLGATLAVVGGLGFVAAFPPVGMWPLVFVSFVPVALAQHRVLPLRWAGVAPTIGVGLYVGYLAWGGLMPHQRWWLLLLIPGLFSTGWVDARWQRATGFRHLWWSSPVLWTAALFILGVSGFASWLDPAYALYRQVWLIQPVSVLSLSGLNLVVLMTNYLLAATVLGGGRRTRTWRAVGMVVLLAVWISMSATLLTTETDKGSVRVAAVQVGVPTNQELTPAAAGTVNAQVFARLAVLTRRAASDGAQVVVWPEKALRYVDPTTDEGSELGRLAASVGVYLVVGYTPDPHRYNRAVIIDPSGRTTAVYNKRHPVTFAGDHSIGGPVVVVQTSIGPIAPIICYDLDFQDTARDAARRGAELLVVPSEDWSGIADQHYTHLVFRAVENRLAAVKADTAWDSAIIDPQGRILASHVNRRQSGALLVADVPLGRGDSAFVTTGNWLGWGCCALSLAWIVIATRERRSERRIEARSNAAG